ncbi:MAG: hypothetical protein Q8P46_03175 [Hyphomicrobiales bacterium]|nr:hypothetical protein [Hyphomicrobiales bacterium]
MLGSIPIDPSLATLTDVDDALAPADADVLTYDSMSGKWVAGTGGVGVESDPKIGTLTNGKWCTTDGSVVNCAADAPVLTESDPQVNTLSEGKWCYVNGGVIDCTQDAPSGTPSGAVMAFNLTSCPTGWSEYTPAKGRFVRGVCLTSSGCQDPDGVRSVGSTQADAFQGHKHAFDNDLLGRFGSSDTIDGFNSNASYDNKTGNPVSDGTNDSPRTASETRSKNVALLYCQKD